MCAKSALLITFVPGSGRRLVPLDGQNLLPPILLCAQSRADWCGKFKPMVLACDAY